MAKSNGECELCGQESSLRSFGDKNLCMKCGIIEITAQSNPQLLIQCLVDAGKMPEAIAYPVEQPNIDISRVEFLEKQHQTIGVLHERLREVLSAKDGEPIEMAARRVMNVLSRDLDAVSSENRSLRQQIETMAASVPTTSDKSKDSILLDIVLASMAGEDIHLGHDVIRSLR